MPLTTAYYVRIRTLSTTAYLRYRRAHASVRTLPKYYGLSARCTTTHIHISFDDCWQCWGGAWFRQARLDVRYVTADGLLSGLPLLSDISVCMRDAFCQSQNAGRFGAHRCSITQYPPITPTRRVVVNEPMKAGDAVHNERQSSNCSNLSRSYQCQADRRLNPGLFTATSS